MSGGLGATIDPQGESGSVQGVTAMQTDVKKTDNMQIQQTTSKETLNKILYGDWIYHGTYTISSSMPAGTVFAIIPIHPSKCNPFVSYVSEMFNAWTGGMKIRQRMIGTAFYGGSIRVGFLPPNMTEAEIAAMPLSVLTAYPNNDLDPKNTQWTMFETSDEREVAYHYMKPYDTNDKASFGGYIVFYVAGKLITQDAAFTSIQMIVETAGGFAFDQVNPRFGHEGSNAEGPIPRRILQSFFDTIGCDVPLVNRADYMAVLPSSIKSVPAGYYGMFTMAGKPLSREKQVSGLPKELVNLWQESGRFALPAYFKGVVKDANTRIDTDPQLTNDFLSPSLPAFCFCADMKVGGGGLKDMMKQVDDGSANKFGWVVKDFKSSDDSGNRIIVSFDSDAKVYSLDFKLHNWYDNKGNLIGLAECAPEISGESIVVFSNARIHCMNVNKLAVSQYFKDHPISDTRNSYLYTVRKRQDGVPMLTLRLLPSGMFTTNATSAQLNVNVGSGDYYLQFESVLPITDPLPPMGSEARLFRRELAYHTRKLVDDPTPHRIAAWKAI
uniref:Calicivirus coat protein n=1 Tax=PNG bee virus 1 TaxID=2746864 RepID=A0A7D5BVX3_9CALI|nr:calicivirus coat protein [PNG bee virus 1]